MPTLLCAESEALEAALQLFDPEQIATLAEDGRALVEALEQKGQLPPATRERLAVLENAG